MTEDKLKPKGEPLTQEQLRLIARIVNGDVERAIGQSDPELKVYLQAKKD